MNDPEALLLLGMIQAVHPKLEEPTPGGAHVWAQILHDVRFDDAREALIVHLRESRFPPKPADVMERARALRKARRDAWERATPESERPLPPVDAPAAYIEWNRQFMAAIADGESTEAADTRACAAVGLQPRAITARNRPVRALISAASDTIRATR